MKVQVDDIRADWELQVRKELDSDAVDRYQDLWDSMPALELYRVEDELLLVDGFHRFEAATGLGLSEVEATITDGTHEQAEEAAILANTEHGLPLTKPERNEAIKRLCALGWNYADIGARFGITKGRISQLLNPTTGLETKRLQPDYDRNTLNQNYIDKRWGEAGYTPEEGAEIRTERLEAFDRMTAPARASEQFLLASAAMATVVQHLQSIEIEHATAIDDENLGRICDWASALEKRADAIKRKRADAQRFAARRVS
jgi:ParB-like chromosome segregation protein Spo0J